MKTSEFQRPEIRRYDCDCGGRLISTAEFHGYARLWRCDGCGIEGRKDDGAYGIVLMLDGVLTCKLPTTCSAGKDLDIPPAAERVVETTYRNGKLVGVREIEGAPSGEYEQPSMFD